MKKRALSIILALCMLISILPSLSVATASGTTFVYDFNEGLATGTAIKGLKFADTNNIWEWHSSNPVSAATAGAKTHKWGIEASASAAGHWFALKINIPASGTYSASISHGQSKSAGGYGDVFIIPGDTADVETAIASISPVGKDIAYYNASANVAEATTPLSDVVVEDGKTGEYIIVFKASAPGSTGYRMYPGAITLTRTGDAPSGGGDAEAPAGPFVYELNYNKNIASDKINIATTYADYSATGNTWMWAGASSGVTTLSYNYNREWVGNDDADTLYKQISGRYIYGVQMKTSAEGAWAAIKISTPAASKYDVSLKYGRHNTGGGYGNIYILPVSTTTDIATALATATPINTIPISYDSNGAGASGEATAYADRVAELGRFTVAEGETEHYVVFVAATAGGGGNFQMFPQSITLTENNAAEPEIPEVVYSGYKAVYDFTNGEDDGRNTTYETTGNFWRYDSVSADFETNENSFKKRGYGIQLQGLNGSKWAALAINVPAKDTYKLTLDHTIASQGGVAQWYIMPAGTNVAENLGDSKYKLSNTIDFYSATTATAVTELGDYTFDKAGEYLLVFTYAGNSPNFTGTGAKSAQYITKLTLDGGSKVLPMTLSGSFDGEVSEDSYAPITVTALMSDGTTSEIESSKLKFASLDEEIATVDTNGNVAGISVGETKITFETKDGFAKGSVDVTVKAFEGEPQMVFVYDFNEGLATGVKVNTINEYGAARGLWKYESAKGANVASSVTHKWGFDLRTHALGDWVALRIKVTTAGRYFATLTHGQSATLGGYGNIYILPKNTADISEALKTATPIGRDVAYYGAANTESVTTELSAVDLTRGEHILVFEASKKGKSNFRQYPGVLELDSSNIFRTLEFDVDKTEYKIYADGTADTGTATYSAKLLDGSEIPEDEMSVVFGSEDDSVAECLDGEIIATGHGTTNITVTVTHNGRKMTRKKEITVTDVSGISSVRVSSDDVNFVGDAVKLTSDLVFNSGKSIKPAQDAVVYEVTSGNGEITDGAYVTSSETGIVSVIAKVSFEGEVYESEPYEVIFREPTTKRGPTYFTEARREAARENIAKYSWAREIRDTSVRNSDKLLETYEYLYDHITGEGIPRSNRVGAEGDPDYEKCRYCGNNNVAEYGSRGGGAYEVNIYKDKWKVQCPDCKRRFPSNDFGLLYERGLDEHGYYNNERARKVNAEAVANGEKDALHNDLFPELYDATKESFNKDPMTGATVDGETWGVDDGLGYLPGRTYSNGIEERHGFIAFYTHELWGGVNVAVRDLAESYIYTGEEKYGRAAAVLIDRIADVYPSFSYKQWDNMYLVAHGGSGYGKIYGRIN
ncbi:MAG: Ig-like domain-containing protein, partial [Oscillospiraceae bacterium]|nr:Ig-like domain-containing protein [Oscillospiraceae bacterium]